MARTTDAAVRSIIDTDSDVSLDGFIKTASGLVTWLDGKDTAGVLTDEQLETIEMWLTAHFYAHKDQLFQSKSTGRASGSFQGQTAMILSSTQYGQTAMLLDVTGNLAALNQETLTGNKKSANLFWLGTELS